VGQVGSTLPALSGTVTLNKVISPATPNSAYAAQPAVGHRLVAVELTVHSPSTAAAKFRDIYANTKLVDSGGLAHSGKGTAKYRVRECAGYVAFGPLGPGQSQTGCEIFQLTLAANPVELKISGKASADWTIAPSAIQSGGGGAAVGATPAPAPAPAVAPQAEGLGASPTTTAVTTPTGVIPTTPATPGRSGRGASTTTVAGNTGAGLATSTSAPAGHHKGQHSAGPRINRVTPRGGYAGSKVLIWGKGLSGATQVTFNGVAAVIDKAQSGRIVVVVPPGATTGPVVVATATGSATSPRTYVVL
jgi:IPT/TIG domain